MPENENGNKPKKKGFLKIIIIILAVVLALIAAAYLYTGYYGLPGWLSGRLPAGDGAAEPAITEAPAYTEEPELSPEVETSPSAEPEASPELRDGSNTEAGLKAEASPEPGQEEKPEASVTPAPEITEQPYIGADAAAEAALKHSKLSEKNVELSSVLLLEQNGMMLYEVKFSSKDYQYEYYIDSRSARVESWRKTPAAEDIPADAAAASAEVKSTEPPAATAAPDKNVTVLIGEEQAKNLAMGHAAISESDISRISCELELEGLSLIYSVDMKTKLMEYDYEIDAISGEIVGFEVEHLKS